MNGNKTKPSRFFMLLTNQDHSALYVRPEQIVAVEADGDRGSNVYVQNVAQPFHVAEKPDVISQKVFL